MILVRETILQIHISVLEHVCRGEESNISEVTRAMIRAPVSQDSQPCQPWMHLKNDRFTGFHEQGSPYA